MEAIRYDSLIELIRALPDEAACVSYLTELRWGEEVISPYDENSKVYKTKRGYRCRNTNKDFNVLTGTVMQGTKVPLIKWIMSLWLLNSEKKGLSSYNLSRKIGVSQNTAWYMLHRLREAYKQETDVQVSGIVELDETYCGGKDKNKHGYKKPKKNRGRSITKKAPVFGILERGGKVYAEVVPNTQMKTLMPIIQRVVTPDSIVYSDEFKSYKRLHKYYAHRFVVHGGGQYVDGDCSTNGIENFWSILKRGLTGIYHFASRKHLQKYVDEFVFRFNTRKMTDSERFYDFLQRTDKRITYKQLTANG